MTIRDLGHSVRYAVLERLGRTAGRIQETKPLPVDLLEGEDAYLAVFDAPGVAASDVQVRYLDNAVLVRIERFREHREGFEMRVPGRGLSLSGRVELPDDAVVDTDAATARLTEIGTLRIRLPKTGSPEDPAVDAEQTVERSDAE